MLSKSLHSSSHMMKNMEQDSRVTEKQGIVTILGSDCERTKTASLRRTLSADMSSKKWLAQQGFLPPMKKIASSKELFMSVEDSNSSSSSDEDEDRFRNRKAHQQKMFHIWTPIDQDEQIQKKKKEMSEGQFDIWSSLVTKKDGAENEENKSEVPEAPYVHPLVKKQSSSLKGKSLEVCTESLGSETGSEGFASYPSSETGDVAVDREAEEQVPVIQQQQQDQEKQVSTQAVSHVEEFQVVKYNAAAAAAVSPGKKSAAVARSFPPPIPSLSGSDGASLRIKSHRDNGRVVLEAVSMPSTNNFRAQRQDGRLVLTFVSATPSCEENSENGEVAAEEQKEEEFDEKLINFLESESVDEDEEEDEDKEKEEEVEVERVVGKDSGIKETEIVMEDAPKMLTSRVTNVHRLALMMKKPIGFANRSHGWAANKYNQVVKYGGDEEEVAMKTTPLAQSLPPRPGRVARLIPKSPAAAIATAATAASLNAYEYYWRTKPTAALNPLSQGGSPPVKSKDPMAYQQQQQLLVQRGNKGDHMVPLSKGCKEPRRSLLFWEPYCIATS